MLRFTQTLGPSATKLVGLDLSGDMIAENKNSARAMGKPVEKMSAERGDLLAEPAPDHLSGPDSHNLDVAAIGMALHHLGSPELALKHSQGGYGKESA